MEITAVTDLPCVLEMHQSQTLLAPASPKRRFSRFTALSAPSAEVLVAKRLQLSFGLTELHSDW